MLKKTLSGSIYTKLEHNYQTLNKIQATFDRLSFGRHNRGQVVPSNMTANTNPTTLLKNQTPIKYLP